MAWVSRGMSRGRSPRDIPSTLCTEELNNLKFGMFQVCVNDINHVHSILFCFTTLVTGNYEELIVMPKEVVEMDSKDLISNTKDTVDGTLPTDDDKQLKAHTINYKSVSFQL